MNIFNITHQAFGSLLEAKVLASNAKEATEKFENGQAFECEVKAYSSQDDVFTINKEGSR
jgi:hypothetical protein